MGVVYEAEHVDMERRVAVKILRAEAGRDPAVIRSFRDEARAASRIQSDFIVQLYDFAALPDGRLMIAMELLTGRPLSRALERPLELSRVFAILRQVCQGLAAAHAAGVVHRDVKPDNIFLTTRDGRSDAVKLVDFGVAAIHDGTQSTAIGGGTPNYLAPEVCIHGSAAPSVDIYSFGCMAHELLTGRVPFPIRGIQQVIAAHRDRPPPLPSALRPEIPAAIDALVVRCMAKDPAARFASMTEVEAALCEAQLACSLRTAWDDLPVPTVEPERRDRLLALLPEVTASSRPRPGALVLVGGALMALLAATVAVILSEPDATDALASKHPVSLTAQAVERSLVHVASPATLDGTSARAGRAERVEAVEHTSASPPPAAQPSDPTASSRRANALVREGRAALEVGQLEQARVLLERAISLDRHHVNALAGLRDIAFEQADYAHAAVLGERVIKERPRSARAHLRLGDAYFKVERFEAALARYERARALGEPRAGSRIERVHRKLTTG